MRRRIRSWSWALAAVAATIWAGPAAAQYFGRNSVQYHGFDFKVLSTAHFDVYYYDEEREAAALASRMAERWYDRHARVLDMALPDRQPLILYAAHPHFEETNVLFERPGEGTGGVTELLKRRIVLPFAGPLAETDHVIGHELVHAFQFAATGEGGPVIGEAPGAELPLWFMEGMAEYLSRGPEDAQTAMWMRSAAASKARLPKITDLDDPQYFPYRWGQALWAWIAGRRGDAAVGRILKSAGHGGAIRALEAEFGAPIDSISSSWQRAIRDAYGGPVDAKERTGAEFAPAIETTKHHGGDYNVGPALSPDGRELVFFSERDIFSMETFLADARTGKVKRRLSSTSVDPHFESLQFLYSAGAWAPDGSVIALAGVASGQPVLAFVRPSDGHEVEEARLPEVDEIYNAAFSPNGRHVVLSAITGGLVDLYVYDRSSRRLDRLTQDAYAELEPAWSPDGSEIAFATDRFHASVDSLEYGPMRLALIDPATRRIRELPGPAGAANTNPQWAPGGRELYFVSDAGGVSNVYRLELASGRLNAVTRVRTGVAGITPLSPAISVASGSGRLVMSVFNDRRFELHAVDDAGSLAPLPTPAPDVAASRLPGAMPGPWPPATETAETAGSAPAARLTTREYRPRLSLDYIGQPSLSVAVDRLGSYVGGGISFFFSDMLGNHRLGTAVQMNGDAQGFGGIASYENRTSRWTWGTSIGRIPYISSYVTTGTAEVSGEPVDVEEVTTARQIEYQAGAATSYPFSRARRVEFNAAYRHLGFSRTVETHAFSQITGEEIYSSTQDVGAPRDLNLVETGAALVYDTSVFGATSPVLGRRYRLEVDPTMGDIHYTGILADYRHYVMPFSPVTLAGRVMHYGRYGRDADTGALDPISLGYSGLVRGYTANSLEDVESDRLLGSRVLVGNVELRAPLLRLFGSESFYGPVPIEIAAFWDGGYAWSSGQTPRLFGGDRSGVSSVGGAARLNVGGYVVLQLDYVRALETPGAGWHWQFDITPGF